MIELSFSEATKSFIKKYLTKIEKNTYNEHDSLISAAFAAEDNLLKDGLQFFLNWFKLVKEKLNQHSEIEIERLNALFLEDLYRSLNQSCEQETATDSDSPALIKFLFLTIAGTIFAACEGFDGITALLEIFSLPAVAIFSAGVAFSFLSVVVFYAFDLVEISKNLGVKLRSVPRMLDLYVREINTIKKIRETIASAINQSPDPEKFGEYLKIIESLQDRQEILQKKGGSLKEQEQRMGLKIAKYFTASGAGLIFFSGGFFAGQTVALKLALFLAAASLSPVSWPVIAFGVVVGLAALGIYWFVERPGIEKLISRWCGLDPQKIEYLGKTGNEERENLQNLRESINNLQDKPRLVDAATQTEAVTQTEPENHIKEIQTNSEFSADKGANKVILSKNRNGLFSHGKMDEYPPELIQNQMLSPA